MLKAGDVVKKSNNPGFRGFPIPKEDETGIVVAVFPKYLEDPRLGVPYGVVFSESRFPNVWNCCYVEDLELVEAREEKQVPVLKGTKYEYVSFPGADEIVNNAPLPEVGKECSIQKLLV